jgi:hypothetical protein
MTSPLDAARRSSHPPWLCTFLCGLVYIHCFNPPPLNLFQGLIDFDVEIAKCEKKLNLARLNLEKVRKVESQPDYEETVPENVRVINEDKV